MANPFFSVIVVCFNAEATVEKTINSVLAQTYNDYEIIVKDGLSHDNTVSRIPVDHRIKVYECADRGIYDAMNQAISYSSGEYVIFMNCGDLFYDNSVLMRIASAADERPACIFGNFKRDGGMYKQCAATNFSLYRAPINHQSIFFDGYLLRNELKFDTSFRIMADYDLEMRFWKSKNRFLYVDYPVCMYEGGGISESADGMVILEKEREIIRKKNYSIAQRLWFSFKYHATLPRLRKMLGSNKSKGIIGKLYIKLRNLYYS